MFRDIIIAIVVLSALVFVALALSPPAPAKADTLHDFFYDPPRRTFSKVRYKGRRGYRAPIEREWDEPNVRCIDDKVEIVSTEHTNIDNAKEAAKKILMATIQWRFGGAYMDLNLAEDYREHCGPSNAMDTASGRLSEAANQLVGQAGQNVRCVIRARPCRAKLERAEGHR